jgi:hypothetical protein
VGSEGDDDHQRREIVRREGEEEHERGQGEVEPEAIGQRVEDETEGPARAPDAAGRPVLHREGAGHHAGRADGAEEEARREPVSPRVGAHAEDHAGVDERVDPDVEQRPEPRFGMGEARDLAIHVVQDDGHEVQENAAGRGGGAAVREPARADQTDAEARHAHRVGSEPQRDRDRAQRPRKTAMDAAVEPAVGDSAGDVSGPSRRSGGDVREGFDVPTSSHWRARALRSLPQAATAVPEWDAQS